MLAFNFLCKYYEVTDLPFPPYSPEVKCHTWFPAILAVISLHKAWWEKKQFADDI